MLLRNKSRSGPSRPGTAPALKVGVSCLGNLLPMARVWTRRRPWRIGGARPGRAVCGCADGAPQNAVRRMTVVYLNRSKFNVCSVWNDGRSRDRRLRAVSAGAGQRDRRGGRHDRIESPVCPGLAVIPGALDRASSCRFLIPALSPPSRMGWAGYHRSGFGRTPFSTHRHRP